MVATGFQAGDCQHADKSAAHSYWYGALTWRVVGASQPKRSEERLLVFVHVMVLPDIERRTVETADDSGFSVYPGVVVCARAGQCHMKDALLAERDTYHYWQLLRLAVFNELYTDAPCISAIKGLKVGNVVTHTILLFSFATSAAALGSIGQTTAPTQVNGT
jgi:hypothetical protein